MKVKEIRYICLLVISSLWLVACRNYTPSNYRGLPKTYNTAYQQIYGHCYDSVPYAVVGLDIYSEGLELDENKRIKGTGYNLCITDIFVPDSLLEEGHYKSVAPDSISPFTFLLLWLP